MLVLLSKGMGFLYGCSEQYEDGPQGPVNLNHLGLISKKLSRSYQNYSKLIFCSVAWTCKKRKTGNKFLMNYIPVEYFKIAWQQLYLLEYIDKKGCNTPISLESKTGCRKGIESESQRPYRLKGFRSEIKSTFDSGDQDKQQLDIESSAYENN